LNKIIFILLLLLNTVFAVTFTKDDLTVLEELGIEDSFSSEKSFNEIFNNYSSNSTLNYYRKILKKSLLNVQIVKDEIKNENLPSFILFIPMLESSFSNQIRGKNAPAGLWQIIPSTAKNLKLRNDEFIDERLDLIKSTDAASSYLKRYYKKFNSWHLAILAYNCGEGRVIEGISRAALDKYLAENPSEINNSNIRSYKNILDNYKKTKSGLSSLYDVYSSIKKLGINYSFTYIVQNNKQKDYIPASSLLYIQKIIAFSMISNRNLFGDIDLLKNNYKLEKVKAPKGLQLKSIATAIGISANELNTLNKHIKKQVLPTESKSYTIYIPQNKLDVYNDKIGNIRPSKENKIIETKKNNKKTIIYYIKKGDSLESIAKAHKISVKKLKIDNKIKSNKLKIGDKIEIYR
jgi:membrane-bound lytic murein transglycosylase D